VVNLTQNDQHNSSIDHTLHLLTAAPRYWPTLLPQLQSLWQSGDLLFLISEAVQGYDFIELKQFDQTAALSSDLALFGIAQDTTNTLQIITSAQWAKWTIEFQRTITWRV
jgi:hypothetical protein